MINKLEIVRELNKYIKIIHSVPKSRRKYYSLCKTFGVGINPKNGQLAKHITTKQDNEDLNILTDIIIVSLLEE